MNYLVSDSNLSLWGTRIPSVITAIFFFSAIALPAQAANLFNIGVLPNGTRSAAVGISDNGQFVVGGSRNDGGDQAILWSEDSGLVALGHFPDTTASTGGVSIAGDGSVVVGTGANADHDNEAFRWTSETGIVGLGDLPGGRDRSAGIGVSADGSVAVGYADSTCGREGFYWTADGGMIAIEGLVGDNSAVRAEGVSSDGLVVVGYSNSVTGGEALYWTPAGGAVGLGKPAGYSYSYAYDVSPEGLAVTGYLERNDSIARDAFLWTPGEGMISLGSLAGFDYTVGEDVSAFGNVVVGQSAQIGTFNQEPFIWTRAGGMRSITDVVEELEVDTTGWSTLSYARAVSADGRRIAGFGVFEGHDRGYMLDLRDLNLQWNAAADGDWMAIENWSGSAGVFLPGETDVVTITPAAGLRVTGPTETTKVGTLNLGATTSGMTTLELQSGGTLTVNGQTTINQRGRLAGSGSFTGSGDIENQGELDLQSGNLQVSGGDFTNTSSGTIALGIGGSLPGQFNSLEFTGAASLDGTLDLIVLDDFAPPLGSTFQVMTFDSSSGAFETINGVALDQTRGLAVLYGENDLTVRTSLLGDLDFDDDVDTADLTTMFQNFSGAGNRGFFWVDGDTDGDGDVDTADITIAFQNFTGANSASLASVPEPSSLTLLGMGILGLGFFLRRKHSALAN